MSINSQILESMKEEGVEGQPPFEIPSGSVGEAMNIDSNVKTQSQETNLTEDLKKRLLNPETEFKSVVEGVHKASSMQELNDEIATKNAISFADAEEIAYTFESFKSRVSLNEFTKTPTKTNLNFTKNFVSTQTRLKMESVLTESSMYFEGQLNDVTDAYYEYKGLYLEPLLEKISEIQKKANQWKQTKGFLAAVYEQDQRYLLDQTPLTEMPDVVKGASEYQVAVQACENLARLAQENVHVKNLILVIKNKEGYKEFSDAKQTAVASTSNPTMLDFITMFANPYLSDFIKQLEESSGEAIATLNSLKEREDFSTSDFNKVRDFVVSNGETIDDCNDMVHYFVEVVEILKKLMLNTSAFIDFFQSGK